LKLVVIGTGYVGLVDGTCFAESGNEVTCVDIDPVKIQQLRRGQIPIYEPGLSELVIRNIKSGRLHFTVDAAAAIGRPAVSLSRLEHRNAQMDQPISRSFECPGVDHTSPCNDAIVVIKSTVPVGTNAKAAQLLARWPVRPVDVASNPEFLKRAARLKTSPARPRGRGSHDPGG